MEPWNQTLFLKYEDVQYLLKTYHKFCFLFSVIFVFLIQSVLLDFFLIF